MIRGCLERVLLGEERGPLSWLVRAPLLPFSLVYSALLKAYLALYALGVRKRCRLPCRVVSVGNLTFGGTGKTPAVIEICRMLSEQGRKTAVLSRGHGGRGGGTIVVSDGIAVLAGADEAGDEPVAIARALPGTPVLVDRDRRRSGRICCERFAPDIIVLDDGLQYWQLHRDLDVVVMDAARPFGSGLVMPAGDLREPVSGLRRAGIVLLNDSDSAESDWLEELRKKLSALSNGAPVLACRRVPVSVRPVDGACSYPADWLRGRRVAAFCGIGKPSSFVEALESVGAVVLECTVFPDHWRYSADDLERIASRVADLGAELAVTTSKDAAKLEAAAVKDLYVLEIRLEIDDRQRLGEYLAGRDGSPR